MVFKRNLLVLKNSGNPEDWHNVMDCSPLYPGIKRTKHSNQFIPEGGFRRSDQLNHLHNITFVNIFNYTCWTPTISSLVSPIKAVRYLPPDSIYSGLKFHNTFLMRGPSTNSSKKLYFTSYLTLFS